MELSQAPRSSAGEDAGAMAIHAHIWWLCPLICPFWSSELHWINVIQGFPDSNDPWVVLFHCRPACLKGKRAAIVSDHLCWGTHDNLQFFSPTKVALSFKETFLLIANVWERRHCILGCIMICFVFKGQ